MNKLMIDGQQSVEKNSNLLLLVDMDKVDKIVLGMKELENMMNMKRQK